MLYDIAIFSVELNSYVIVLCILYPLTINMYVSAFVRHFSLNGKVVNILFKEYSKMHVWGKILGFVFGFMLSKNLFGALLGLWLGHLFDRGRGFNFKGIADGQEDEISR